MADLREGLGTLVQRIEQTAPYGAALLSTRQSFRITVDNREERVIETPPSMGSVLTAFDGTTLHEKAVGGFDRRQVERGARDLLAGISLTNGKVIDPGPEHKGEFITAAKIPASSLTIQEKLERCREIHRRMSNKDPRIVNVRILYNEFTDQSVFRNRTADLAQRVDRVILYVFIFVQDERGMRYNWLGHGGTGGWEVLTFSDEELQDLVDKTVALLSAERIEPGEYTVVTAPGVTGTIVHESFGHGVETDMFVKERARAAQFIDQVVGSPLVNIWDDPSYPGVMGSYFFDDEGMLASPTQIVENGVFRRGITDLYSATQLGIPRSANGRRQDYSRKAYARMSNTFFASGTTPVEDLISQVDRGIYVDKWSSGMEDPQGWGIQVTCHYGHEIRSGRITERMFAPIAISGYLPEVLQSISAVGSDMKFDAGGCGKGHKEIIRVSSGGATLLLKARLG